MGRGFGVESRFMRVFFVMLVMVFAGGAEAQLYVCPKPGGGGVRFASVPDGDGCRLQKSFERVNQPARSADARVVEDGDSGNLGASGETAVAARAAAVPVEVVSAAVQRLRDKKRGRILLHEYRRERQRQRLAQTQLEELQGEGGDEENAALVAHLQKQVRIHSQNVAAIEQELARLR